MLHPELAPDGVGLPGDDRTGASHWVAMAAEVGLIGVVSVMPEAPPWDPPGDAGWRLRGMATAPEVRGWGVGAELVARVLEHARAQQGRVLWCTARMAAVGFYQRQGFVTRGETWEEPVIGTHIHMLRPL
ncbi:MAG: GNAT family N-acetyltransferase [Acidimicrobiales bacterium]